MAFEWTPAKSLAACDALLQAPGSPFELEPVVVGPRRFRAFKHLPRSLRDFFESTKAFGPRTILVYEQERYTYAQMHARVDEIASLLAARGAKKGDRVGLLSRNYPEWVMCFYAAQVLGCIAVAVNCWTPAPVMLHCLSTTQCKIVVLDEERALLLASARDQLSAAGCTATFVLKCATFNVPDGMESLDAALRPYVGSPTPRERVDIAPDDDSCIFFTSGTTGLPKGVLSSQRAYLTSLMCSLYGGARSILRRGEALPVPDPTAPQKGALLAIPLFHVSGNQSILTSVLAGGGKLAMIHSWKPAEGFRILKEERLTMAGGIPFLVQDLLEMKFDPGELALDLVGFGGQAGSSSIPSDVRRRMPGVDASQGYGLTETNAIVAAFNGEDYLRKPTACGIVSPCNQIKIMDLDSGLELPVGGVGEIWISGPNVAKGYWRNEKATKEAFPEEGQWFRSGDIGRLDEENFLYILDRAKDIIIRGGENISTITVENALYNTDVKDVCVVALPDARFGEVPGAVVVVRAGRALPTESALLAQAARQLPKHAMPAIVLVTTDELPRNAAGKTLKAEVKQLLLQALAPRRMRPAKL